MSTTKQQERVALEKIRKIVADLGELSYIGTAMLGVWEIAEENIEYDSGVSAREKWEHTAAEASELRNKVRELEQDLCETRKIANEQLDRVDRLREDLDRERECSAMCKQERDDAQDEAKSLAADLERSGFQIMELKAKLYDHIVGVA